MIVVPNEKMVSGDVFNHSTGDQAAPVTVSAWLPADADLDRAEEALKEGTGAETVEVAEWTSDGIRLEVKLASEGHTHPGRRRGGRPARAHAAASCRRRACSSRSDPPGATPGTLFAMSPRQRRRQRRRGGSLGKIFLAVVAVLLVCIAAAAIARRQLGAQHLPTTRRTSTP